MWTANYTESWSAFAPGFTELEENEIYIEREDDFDISDDISPEPNSNIDTKEDEDIIVDILTIDKIGALSSDSEEDLWYLPTIPIPDESSLNFCASLSSD